MTTVDPANDGAELYADGRQPCLVCSYLYPTKPNGALIDHSDFSSGVEKPCPGSNSSWDIT